MPRLRFSLRAFLLLLSVGSLIGSNLFTAWQLDKLRTQNAEMAKELGRLVVTDRNKINVVAVPTYEDMLWRWRIYVPKGRSLYLCGSTHAIPQTGYPENFSAMTLTDGECLLTAAIRRDRQNKWQLTLARESGSSSSGIADEDSDWLVDSPGWGSEQAGTNGTELFNAEEPLVLLRVRSMEKTPGGGSTSSQSPTGKGVMVWIKKP
jgi:hypothetical protein